MSPRAGRRDRRRRRPPTIDLKATEVAERPAAGAQAEPGAEAAASASEPPRRHPAIAWLPPDFPWPLVGGRRRRRGAHAGGAGPGRRVLEPRRRRDGGRHAARARRTAIARAGRKAVAGRGRYRRRWTISPAVLRGLETIVATPQVADHRSGAGESHRDARRRPQGAGRTRRRARPAQRRDRLDRGRGAHPRRCGRSGGRRIEEGAGAGRARGEAGRDRSLDQPHRRARARRQGDGGAARRPLRRRRRRSFAAAGGGREHAQCRGRARHAIRRRACRREGRRARSESAGGARALRILGRAERERRSRASSPR